MDVKELGTKYILETKKELCGGYVDKKYEYNKLDELETAVEKLPIDVDIVETYRKTKLSLKKSDVSSTVLTDNKSITFHMTQNQNSVSLSRGIKNSYYETLDAIESGDKVINTTQLCLLKTTLFEKGYRIFIRGMDNNADDIYEIKLGLNERTSREIRMVHNLFNLLLSGEFCDK